MTITVYPWYNNNNKKNIKYKKQTVNGRDEKAYPSSTVGGNVH
jgi:hypothetical protein